MVFLDCLSTIRGDVYMEQFDAKLTTYALAILGLHPMTNLMVRVFLPKKYYHFFALIYCYFRWLDDQIDSAKLDISEKESLLARAYTIIKTPKVDSLLFPEKCLLEALSYADINKIPVRMSIEQMIIAIDLDMKRVGRIPSAQELQRLCILRMCSYLNMLKILARDENLMDMPPDYGIACDEIHILRDMYEDFDRGIFNFSKEDIERYGLDASDLSHTAWNLWFRSRIENAGKLLRKGYWSLLTAKPSRYTGMCLLMLPKYLKCWLALKAKHFGDTQDLYARSEKVRVNWPPQ
jgi:hypothetical protein